MHLAFRDEAHDVVVHVANSLQEPGLNRLEIDLHRSRDFWYTTQDDEDEREALDAEYARRYEQLVVEYNRLLGSPTYTGVYKPDDPDYPEGEAADHLTYWQVGGDRLQLSFT